MAFIIPTVSYLRAQAEKISKPISYTGVDEETGKLVTYSGKLEGVCKDTPEGLAELAARQTAKKVNMSRKKVEMVNGLLTAGEVKEVSPGKLAGIFFQYTAEGQRIAQEKLDKLTAGEAAAVVPEPIKDRLAGKGKDAGGKENGQSTGATVAQPK